MAAIQETPLGLSAVIPTILLPDWYPTMDIPEWGVPATGPRTGESGTESIEQLFDEILHDGFVKFI